MKVFIFHFTLFPTPLDPLSNNPSIFPLEILLVRDPSIWLTESIRIVRELYAKTIVIFVSFSSAWWPFPPNYTTNLPMSDDSQLISLILISFLNVFYVKASRDFTCSCLRSPTDSAIKIVIVHFSHLTFLWHTAHDFSLCYILEKFAFIWKIQIFFSFFEKNIVPSFPSAMIVQRDLIFGLAVLLLLLPEGIKLFLFLLSSKGIGNIFHVHSWNVVTIYILL